VRAEGRRRRPRRRAVRDLFRPHGLKYRTAASVACRQSTEVIIEVPFDLTLGLGTNPRLARSPSSAAAAPMAKDPAYQSGLSRLGRAASSFSASHTTRDDRIRSAPRPSACRASRRSGRRRPDRDRAPGSELAGVVDAHEGRAGTPFRTRQGRGVRPLGRTAGTGRDALAGAKTERSPRSRAAMAESRRGPDSISKSSIIGQSGLTNPTAGQR